MNYLLLLSMNTTFIRALLNHSYKDYPSNPSQDVWDDYINMNIMGGEL